MNAKQALYEKCFLKELEDVFFYARVLGGGKERIEGVDTSNFSNLERMQAQMDCRNWVDIKLLDRFNNDIFTEPVEILIRLDKQKNSNIFQIEGETYKLIMQPEATEKFFRVFLRSMLKDEED